METEGQGITNILMVVAVVAVAFSAVNFFATLALKPTGYANLDTGTANLTISSSIELNFVQDIVDWGTGYVTPGNPGAILDTEGNMTGTDWTPQSQGLVLESTSNILVEVTLNSSLGAIDFIDGGTAQGSSFRWKVKENEVGACPGTLAPSSYTDASTTGVIICSSMDHVSTANELLIDLELNVSATAPTGTKGTILTAIGAPAP